MAITGPPSLRNGPGVRAVPSPAAPRLGADGDHDVEPSRRTRIGGRGDACASWSSLWPLPAASNVRRCLAPADLLRAAPNDLVFLPVHLPGVEPIASRLDVLALLGLDGRRENRHQTQQGRVLRRTSVWKTVVVGCALFVHGVIHCGGHRSGGADGIGDHGLQLRRPGDRRKPGSRRDPHAHRPQRHTGPRPEWSVSAAGEWGRPDTRPARPSRVRRGLRSIRPA